jgi:AAA domain
VTRTADLKRARPFKFAWEKRVLLGYLNLLVGEEGVGKGTLIAWLAAQVTGGSLPGDLHGKPRRVVIIGDEDSFDHIWGPRIEVAGGDLSKVEYVVSGPDNGALDVREDADALRDLVVHKEIALVYFDQLLDNLGYVDNWKDKQIRDALAPLRAVAQDTDAAMLAAMHPNKRSGSFRDRISGSPAFNALSRSSLYVAKHPHVPDRRVVVRAKGNYNVEPMAFEFNIESRALTVRDGRKRFALSTSRVCDTAETYLTADEVLAERQGDQDTEIARAERLLRELLSDYKKHPSAEIIAAMTVQGFGERKVRDAAKRIGVHKRRDNEFQARTNWWLPKPHRNGDGAE